MQRERRLKRQTWNRILVTIQRLTPVIGVSSASNTTVSSRRDLVKFLAQCLC